MSTTSERATVDSVVSLVREMQATQRDLFMTTLESEAMDLCVCEERRSCLAHRLVGAMAERLYKVNDYPLSRPWARKRAS